jgi:small-conductance mechanosensitive channel
VIRSILEAEVFPRRRFDRGIRDAIKKLLHYSMVFVGFLFAMSLAGVELKNFAVLAGAFGIGIGFGLQNIVNNFVSGIILLFERPIKVGDIVIIDNAWGTVLRIGLRSTVVTTLDESEIIVPNSLLVSEMVTNWSLTSPLCRVSIPVGVAYGSDVPLVLKILVEAGEENEDILTDPAPSPLFNGFGDSSLDFELRVWISNVRDRLRVRSEVCQFIDRRFREEGVEIPFPQRDLHFRSVSKGFSFAQAEPPAGDGNET